MKDKQYAYVLHYDFDTKPPYKAKGELVEAQNTDQVIYEFPNKNKLVIQRPEQGRQDTSEESIIAFVNVEIPITRIDNDYPPQEHDVYQFPPTGAHHICKNGETAPSNLRELVDQQIQLGWTASPELMELLKSATVVAG